MGKRTEAVKGTLELIDKTSKSVNFFETDNFNSNTTNLLLSHIAMNLAVIADKLTEDDNDYKQNEEVPVRPVPGSDMVASEGVENANVSSSSDIQKDDKCSESENHGS